MNIYLAGTFSYIMGITQVCLKVGYGIVIVPLTTYITKKVAEKEEMNI